MRIRRSNYLIDEIGLNVDKTSSDESITSIHIAAYYGSTSMCRLLIEKNADVNRRTAAGETPLSMSLRSKNIEVITLLLGSGAAMPTVESSLRMEVLTWDLPEIQAVFRRNNELKSTTEVKTFELDTIIVAGSSA